MKDRLYRKCSEIIRVISGYHEYERNICRKSKCTNLRLQLDAYRIGY